MEILKIRRHKVKSLVVLTDGMKCTFRSHRCKDIVYGMTRAIQVGVFFFSFKATGCLDLTFDIDCGPENDKTLSFSKRSFSHANFKASL